MVRIILLCVVRTRCRRSVVMAQEPLPYNIVGVIAALNNRIRYLSGIFLSVSYALYTENLAQAFAILFPSSSS